MIIYLLVDYNGPAPLAEQGLLFFTAKIIISTKPLEVKGFIV